MIIEVTGNLLDIDAQYIAHQCNCRSTGSAGLAKQIFQKYPYSDIYKKGRDHRRMGMIHIARGEKNIINMFAQFYPGKSKEDGVDTKHERLKSFISCLQKILEIEDLKSVAFPYGIGCGLAGGDWNDYKKILEAFSEKAFNKDIKVYLVKYEEAPKNIKKIYTGIGAREVGGDICLVMSKIAYKLAQSGWSLRSGGAKGSDLAFETGCLEAGGDQEIYLPNKNFGTSWSRLPHKNDVIGPSPEAVNIIHKVANKYGDFNPKGGDWYWNLLGRNVHQILGKNLDNPSQKVFCYTKGGKDVGGTRWALRVARMYDIEIINLGNNETLEKYKSWIS